VYLSLEFDWFVLYVLWLMLCVFGKLNVVSGMMYCELVGVWCMIVDDDETYVVFVWGVDGLFLVGGDFDLVLEIVNDYVIR